MHKRDRPTNDVTTRSIAQCASHYVSEAHEMTEVQQLNDTLILSVKVFKTRES